MKALSTAYAAILGYFCAAVTASSPSSGAVSFLAASGAKPAALFRSLTAAMRQRHSPALAHAAYGFCASEAFSQALKHAGKELPGDMLEAIASADITSNGISRTRVRTIPYITCKGSRSCILSAEMHMHHVLDTFAYAVL